MLDTIELLTIRTKYCIITDRCMPILLDNKGGISMKRFLTAFLALCLFLSLPSALARGESFDFHQGASGRTAMSVTSISLGCRFGATAPFDRLTLSCPSWSDNVGTLTFQLFPWRGEYGATVSDRPLAEKTFVDYADNADLSMEADCGAGEYLILLKDGKGGVGVWGFSQSATGTRLYQNGVEQDGVFTMTVHYTVTPEVPFAPVESAGSQKADFVNEPVVYPPDHPTIARDAMADTWAAIDGLGRAVADREEAGEPRDRFVGIFFWTWHSHHSVNNPVNLTKLLEEHPEAADDYYDPIWQEYPSGAYHWNEPIYGFYDGTDKWVLRRQAELLAAAGVDVVIFDNTNGTMTWQDGYTALLETFAQARADGVKTPQIAFMLPFVDKESSGVQLRSIYLDIYRQGKYRDLWFYWKGKPLVMGSAGGLNKKNDLDAEIMDFFTFRPGQPKYDLGETAHLTQWGWLSIYPPTKYYAGQALEEIPVGVAQNYNAQRGLTAMSGEGVFGRTYTSKGWDTRENAKLYGANFAEQFEYAIEADPEFIFITGWNEWVAGHYMGWGGVQSAFPDEYIDEFSRDIEPSKGDLKDHYYYQMVNYIRRFKGVRAVPESSGSATMALDAGDEAWEAVLPRYVAYRGDTFDRDAHGYGDLYYTDQSGRNDLIECRVARDDENLWFTVLCAEDITAPGENWMRLLIDLEDGGDENWEGFEYIVNRETPGETARLERSRGGWQWEEVCPVEYHLEGRRLTLRVPRAALGLEGKFTLRFKWTDNTLDDDILSVYTMGDTAPIGRFTYVYQAD